jgi:hypothetical protein
VRDVEALLATLTPRPLLHLAGQRRSLPSLSLAVNAGQRDFSFAPCNAALVRRRMRALIARALQLRSQHGALFSE